MYRPGIFAWICWILVIIGALNWGLVGAFNFNLVAALLGDMTTASRVVYILVGLAAIGTLVTLLSRPRVDAYDAGNPRKL